METILHSLMSKREVNPHWDLFAIDADNAFNSANRMVGLLELNQRLKGLLPLMRAMYSCNSDGWFFGQEEGIESVPSKAGYHQGDVMATWMYILTIQPLLKGLEQHLAETFPLPPGFEVPEVPYRPSYECWFYLDDGNILAPHHVMLEIIAYLRMHGPKYGYVIKLNKGGYLLGKCGDRAAAQAHLDDLVEAGVSPDIIKMHPDDMEVVEDELDVSKRRYGVKILGCFVGDEHYIHFKLAEYLEELKTIATKLDKYPDLQGRMLLFRYCFVTKPLHLLRTLPPRITALFCAEFEQVKRKVLCSILGICNTQMPIKLYEQCCLPIRKGGLGIHLSSEIAPAAYCASMASWLKQQFGSGPQKIEEIIDCLSNLTPELSHLSDLVHEVQKHFCFVGMEAGGDVEVPEDTGWKDNVKMLLTLKDQKQESSRRETVQNQLMDRLVDKRFQAFKDGLNNTKLAWFVSLQSREAGAWLEAIPKFEKLAMDSTTFRSALCYRYMIKYPGMIDGARCDCEAHTVLDPTAHHLATACGKYGYRKDTHDSVVLELQYALQHCGFWIKREERDCFLAADPNDRHIPDLTVMNPIDSAFPQVLLDVSITSPLTGALHGQLDNNALTRAAAGDQGRMARRRYQEKVNKYRARVLANGFGFVPIIFESTGLIHAQSLQFLEASMKKAAEIRKISCKNIYAYLIKRLSVTLQKAIAQNVNKRLIRLLGHSSAVNRDPAFRYEAMMDEELVG